jgi:hypothetical protein
MGFEHRSFGRIPIQTAVELLPHTPPPELVSTQIAVNMSRIKPIGQSSWLHNGDVLWFLWGTNWIYICYAEESRPPDPTSHQRGQTLAELRWWGPAATANYRPVLSSERTLHNTKPQLSKRKTRGERKIGRGSQMGAWRQDWLSVVMWLWLWLDRLCGLVARVPGYIREIYCASCEVRTEFIYVM